MLASIFLTQICSALAYAHGRGVIHRDINPTNIIVQRNDRLKILDFGLACPIGTEDFSNAGTAYYMAPEQIKGDPVDPRTDIYAMGIIAFEMVTDKQPFKDKRISALFDENLKRDILDPAEFIPDLPKELRQFILKASHSDPEQRYQNTDQALEALGPLIKEAVLTRNNLSVEKHNISTFFLIYKDEHQLPLNQLMDELRTKIHKLGVELKVADFRDV